MPQRDGLKGRGTLRVPRLSAIALAASGARVAVTGLPLSWVLAIAGRPADAGARTIIPKAWTVRPAPMALRPRGGPWANAGNAAVTFDLHLMNLRDFHGDRYAQPAPRKCQGGGGFFFFFLCFRSELADPNTASESADTKAIVAGHLEGR